jgi:hypothetical protein
MATPQCDLRSLFLEPQRWNQLDDFTIISIQVALMCDALDGIPTNTININAYRKRVSCINKDAKNTILGMWTELFGQLLTAVSGGTAIGSSQILVYNGLSPGALVPGNPNLPALAYGSKSGPSQTLFQWDVPSQTWY